MGDKIQETIIFRPDESIKGLTVRQLCVFKEISKILGDHAGRVNYADIAAKIGITRNGVSYVVNTLVKANVLERKDGKLKILKKIVL